MLIGSLGSKNFVTRSGVLGRNSSSTSTSGRSRSAQRAGVRDFMTRLVSAGESVQSLRDQFEDVEANSARTISAKSIGGAKVALNTSGTKSTLVSTTGISSLTTMVEDRNPAWGKPHKSTAGITVHGTYTGTVDAEYEITSGNTLGFNVGSNKTYTLRAYKNGARILPNIVIPKRYTEGTQLTVELGSGLSVSFTEDVITKRDSFTINALTGVDVTADPNAAFDGSSGVSANLDSAVTAGTFELNGTTITVADDDTIESVVSTINASGAGVSAAYDASTDLLTLTHNTRGAEAITVGSDTSGFLAAMKLDTASVSLGEGDQREQVIEDVGLLSGVSSGTFDVNGVTFSVDVTTDTLSDLIDRVNASEADVVMSYSSSTDRLSFRSASGDDPLTVENDTTGLFETFAIEEGESKARKTRGISSKVSEALIDQLSQMVELLNEMGDTVAYESVISEGTELARDQLRAAIRDGFDGGSGDTLDTGFGLVFNVAEDSTQPFAKLDQAGQRELERALKRNPSEVLDRLFGSKPGTGLMNAILSGMQRAQKTVTRAYGSVGLMLDITA